MSIEELDKRIDKALSRWETPSKQNKKDLWRSIEESIETKPVRKIKRWHWSIAASVAASILFISVYYNSNVVVSSNFGETIGINLPDGSSVNLNEESSVSYNSIMWYASRSVSMSGEAFFKVTKGSQFKVKTNNGVVKVLGTSFNIISREKRFDVDCFTGKVRVDNNNTNVVITKGESVSQTNDKTLTKGILASNQLAPIWMMDNHSYNKVKLANVLEDIENQYDITIKASENISKMKFTGEWNSEMVLDDV